MLNPKLTVGDVAEQVTVSGDAVQLATYDSGTVSTQLDSNRIDQLPQNGRNVLGLAQETVPGVEANGTRANGIMQEGMEYSQDGAPMTNRNFGGEANSAQATLPDPDSVQEAKFETLNSSAQFSTPATVILTTKSGTNEIHGSAFETARNNYFGVAKARQNPANFAAPHLVRNEFGASVGGPISIPKLYNGKNKILLLFRLRALLSAPGVERTGDRADRGDEKRRFQRIGQQRRHSADSLRPQHHAAGHVAAHAVSRTTRSRSTAKVRWPRRSMRLRPFRKRPTIRWSTPISTR